MTIQSLSDALQERILLLDGAMGTMIQSCGLSEEDFHCRATERAAAALRGNNDLLSLSRPDVVLGIHRRYLEAGADIITTNTFNAQRISQADYGCEALVKELNTEAVGLARQAAHEFSTPEWPRYVVATVGPTNKSCSLSPDVENPAHRSISFDEMASAYEEQMEALLMAGPDAILLETVFDTLNAKAAIFAFQEASLKTGIKLPLMLSATLNDRHGRLLCGQTLEALLISVAHARLLCIGLNCSFGAAEMLPSLRRLASLAPCYVSAHPNAGLPNEMGSYDQTPEMMASAVRPFIEEGLVNILGGCCGTTPEHIAALRPLIGHGKRRMLPDAQSAATLRLSGLEPLELTPEVAFVNVGERCNVAGSRRFLRLIREKAYDEALQIARRQVEDGALVLDINMDDGLLDARTEMCTFLNLLGSEPDICRVPLMIDSSRWEVIEAALKCVQGKSVVNSLSLKEGEDIFLARARQIHRLGAAVVVMAFDEEGQATTLERRIAICQRAYRLLTERIGFPAEDIIFDPNILSIATGISEHDSYALHFIEATRWIRQNLPGAHVSGGVSNLSFAFRGNNYLREAMHAVFLYHARRSGLDMAIVNPSERVCYDDIPAEQLQVIEDAILRPSTEATERLTELAASLQKDLAAPSAESDGAGSETQPKDIRERLIADLLRGGSETLEADLEEALGHFQSPIDIIEGPLMEAMQRVGQAFGEGKMFLPQVVKAARTMKRAVGILSPRIDALASSAGTVLLATVKGDVHDIGKNIVATVMACNGYRIIDLGVMVPAEDIVAAALQHKPDIIGLSGLITPSLEEMVQTVRQLRQAGIDVPVMIGGATTSEVHTALRIAPVYAGPVVWVHDASLNAPLANRLLNPRQSQAAREEISQRQADLRSQQQSQSLRSLDEARRHKLDLFS